MATAVLRELAGPHPWMWFEEPWFWYGRTARLLTDGWQRVARHALADGSAEELHAGRADYEAVLLTHLKVFDGLLVIASRFGEEVRPTDLAVRIAEARDRLRGHYDSLFPRWQTLADLEAILLELASVPHDRLKDLAAQHPPDPSWYKERVKKPAPKE
ncbi:MAG: hypothetical protein C0501_21845 [Isosphaera sp.]|nr:hypothetical protein [Isosphaera sp.]